MDKLSVIKELLLEAELPLKDYRVSDMNNSLVIYINEQALLFSNEAKSVSKRRLKEFVAKVESDILLKVEIIVVSDPAIKLLEKTLLKSLKTESNLLENLSININFLGPNFILINSSQELEEEEKNSIREKLTSVLPANVRVESKNIEFVYVYSGKPEAINILREIKINQPVVLSVLQVKLSLNLNDDIKWLKRQLDDLRKRNFIVYQNEGYALTIKGLEAVPAGRFYKSSDIERALALSKRKW